MAVSPDNQILQLNIEFILPEEELPMANNLKLYFPAIRSREELLQRIRSDSDMMAIFDSWSVEQREEFLDMCTGNRGVKILYDQFFKEIFAPDVHPERLEELLSLILKAKVKIVKILPNDSPRIAAEKSLLAMDIIVQLEDGSLANIEVQKIGYAFPGQRSACYSADLLLRQYRRVRNEKGKKFSYRDIKKVYTIVFFEKSTKEFHRKKEQFIHRMKQHSDTGVEVELLQEYIFVTLDNFIKVLHNGSVNINNELEAWLTFLSSNEPEYIIQLIKQYPKFKEYYEEVYEMCLEVDEIMGIFSEELAILDSNTVDYMMDEMQAEIDKLQEKKTALEEEKTALEEEKRRSDMLLKLLADAGRIEDIQKVLADSKHREKLYKEFCL